MRALTAQETTALAARKRRLEARLEIADETGAFVDFSTLRGHEWLRAVEYGEHIDDGCMSASVTVTRAFWLNSLSPMVSTSPLNRRSGVYSPAIAVQREVKLYTATLPVGVEPTSSDWRLVFHGYIDAISESRQTISLQCYGLGQELHQRWVEDDTRTYGGVGVTIESVIQALIDDNSGEVFAASAAYAKADVVRPTVANGFHYAVTVAGTAGSEPTWPTAIGATVTSGTVTFVCHGRVPQLYVPAGATGAGRGEFTQAKKLVDEAVRDQALGIGWDLRYYFDNSTGTFRYTLQEPARESPVVVHTFGTDEYLAIPSITQSVADVRNAVRGHFYDSADLDSEGKPSPTSRLVEDPDSILKYKRQYGELAEDVTSAVNTEAEMLTWLGKVVSDLAEPTAHVAIELPYWYAAQLHDYYSFEPCEFWSSTQSFAVIGSRHRLSFSDSGGEGFTSLQVRGKPTGAIREWHKRIAQANVAKPAEENPPVAPTIASVTKVQGGYELLVTPPTGKWETFELHESASSSFTPSSSTLVASQRGTRFVRTDIANDSTRYLKVVALDSRRNPSSPSTEYELTQTYNAIDTSGHIGSHVGQSDGVTVRTLAKGHYSGQGRHNDLIAFPVAYQNPPLIILRGGLTHEPRAKWGPAGSGSETGAYSSTTPTSQDLAAVDLDANGFTLRARLAQKGTQTAVNINADDSSNLLNAVGETAEVTLASAPSGAAGDQYTLHFSVSVDVVVDAPEGEPGGGTARVYIAIDSLDSGGAWVERASYSYAAAAFSSGPGAADSETYAHEQKTVTVSGLTSGAPADKFRIRAKSFSLGGYATSGGFDAHLFSTVAGDPATGLTFATASNQYANATPDDTGDVIYWEAIEVS